MTRHLVVILVGLTVGALVEWRLGLELIGADLCLQVGYTRCWRRFASARPVVAG